MLNLYDIKNTQSLLDDHYQLINRIGGGGFSEVWLAHDVKAQVDVVLKVYASSQELNDEGITMFRKEFALVCNLSHSNILKPFTFDISHGSPYIVLPYCGKGSAAQLIGKIDEKELWNFIEQVSSGLAYLHSHHIIHQDIKPANVLINADNQYLITDFGISTGLRNTIRHSMKDGTSDLYGTTAYMSHESMGAKPVNVIARDIWALGATIYEMATGDVPFGDFGGLTQKSGNDKAPKIGKGFSEKMERLVAWCLELEPWNRPSAEDILEYCKSTDFKPKGAKARGLRKKLIATSAAASVVLATICLSWFNGCEESDPSPINPNDSVLLARTSEACAIVDKEKIKVEIDDRKVYNLCKAAEIYKEAISIDATDSIVSAAKSQWTASQAIIDETYTYLEERTKYYEELKATEAERTFRLKRDSLVSYASDMK